MFRLTPQKCYFLSGQTQRIYGQLVTQNTVFVIFLANEYRAGGHDLSHWLAGIKNRVLGQWAFLWCWAYSKTNRKPSHKPQSTDPECQEQLEKCSWCSTNSSGRRVRNKGSWVFLFSSFSWINLWAPESTIFHKPQEWNNKVWFPYQVENYSSSVQSFVKYDCVSSVQSSFLTVTTQRQTRGEFSSAYHNESWKLFVSYFCKKLQGIWFLKCFQVMKMYLMVRRQKNISSPLY